MKALCPLGWWVAGVAGLFFSLMGAAPVEKDQLGRPEAAPCPVEDRLSPVQLVKSTRVSIGFEVVNQGPSGVARVEVWVTRDDGQTWQMLANETNPKSPITVDLPGEGVYGFRLVVQNQVGLGKHPPVSGDRPEKRVEVDTTPPTAQLLLPDYDPAENAIVLRWEVADSHLGPTPISLQWSEHRGGPWTPIASGLANSGSYRWKRRPSLPVLVFLRLAACDQAGNVIEVTTPAPVLLDRIEPEARITEITETKAGTGDPIRFAPPGPVGHK